MQRVRFLAAKTAFAAVLADSIITSTHAGIWPGGGAFPVGRPGSHSADAKSAITSLVIH